MQTRRDFLKAALAAIPALAMNPARAPAAVVPRPAPAMDLDFIASRMELVRRSAWCQTQPNLRQMRAARGFDRITLHHAGNAPSSLTTTDSVIREMDGVLTAHRERHYGDIGYHFVVDYGGRVWEGRSLLYEGAHVLSENERNIGIMVLGNFERQRPSAEQVSAVARLTPLLRSRYRIPRHRVYGHCDLGQSVCPGKNLYAQVVRLRG